MSQRVRLDLDLLDDDDPFEIDDDNRPHLFKHSHYGEDDLLDMWIADPLFFPAKVGGEADWLMVAEVPGEPPLVVPMAASRSGDPRKIRPIGIYTATGQTLTDYMQTREQER